MPSKPAIFRPPHLRTAKQIERDYEQRRGNERQRGYTKALRKMMDVFKLSHPLCLGCKAVGMITATTVTDHVIPAKGDRSLLWDPENLQPCCAWHHNVIKQLLEALYAKHLITATDLKLDSAKAIEITKREGSTIGADGWPMAVQISAGPVPGTGGQPPKTKS